MGGTPKNKFQFCSGNFQKTHISVEVRSHQDHTLAHQRHHAHVHTGISSKSFVPAPCCRPEQRVVWRRRHLRAAGIDAGKAGAVGSGCRVAAYKGPAAAFGRYVTRPSEPSFLVSCFYGRGSGSRALKIYPSTTTLVIVKTAHAIVIGLAP